ncbi:dynein axonemal heavy chain 8-like [Lutzomyia longipalpis]|uniref:dynein axonemal heavy chain 8-like n=1 Tax=Lutzomyia longipalpis TaxID=7200 RepID=UPI002483AA7F|nr:dynein axonemal heavy chain 8-like [Lutzomyia longipalpis]
MERTVRSGINARKWLKKKKGPEFGEELRLHRTERSRRGDTITSLHKMIFEMAAYQLKINVDLVAEGYMDSEDHVAFFRSFCAVNGKFHIFFAYGAFAELPLTSGRYETLENWRQRTRIERVTMSNEDPTDLTAKCALIYRVDNTEKITLKNYQDLTYQRSFEALKSGETLITRFTADLQGFVESNALGVVQANIDASMSEEEAACLPKTSVNDQFMRCVEDLRMVDQRIRERPLLEIDQKLFEGFLIRDVVIAETSKNPEKVLEIEKIFLKWMVQIRRILTENHHIYREIPSVGPLSEMLHWKNVLMQYTFVEAAIDTREFQSVLQCLTLAQSRLLKEWKKIKEDLNNSLIETRDINIFLESLGKYFDDLHKKSPGEVINQFPGLLKIIRSVSENSQHYQSPRKICEFVGAFITQMVILCRRHIEEDSSVWSQERSKLIERIETARNFLNTLEEKYKLIPDWECSIQHNFMEKKLLMERLMMVEKIFNIMDSFSVLDRIVMASMEDFGRKMKENFAELSSNPLSPLDGKNKSFSEDFGRFMRQTAAVEREVAEMMTNLVENCQTAAAMLLIVNQFRKFNLNCLCIENQYVTVARKLNKEAQRVYNNYMFMFAMEQSAQDSEQMSASEGIYLLRGLLRSIEDPINEVLSFNSVRVNQEIFEGLHCLDWIRPIFAKKERKLYKRWFIEMSTIVAKALKEPVFKRDFANNSGYAVNFKQVINQAIHESDKMQKIDLKLPAVGKMLLASKETLLQHRDALLLCAKKDRQLRRSIPQIFLELMTPWLRRVDRLFKEGQTLVCWQSSTLPTFIENLNGVLDETKDFVKQICDFSLIVEEHLAEISTEILLTVPQAPIPIEEFKQLNFNHFQEVVKTFLAKSAYIEKIVIGMIEKFCNGVDFPLNDDAERPQFQQSSANYGEEDSSLPINKYDWIDFANLPRRVDLPAMEEEVLWSDFDAVNFNLQYFHKNCMDVFNFFYDQFLSKLGNVFLNTLDFLAYQMSKRHEKDTGIVPIIAIKLNLKKFRFTIEPSLEAIRDHMGAIFKGLQGFFMKIPSWGFQAKIKERLAMKAGSWEKIYPKNVYSFILERVDMTKSLESFEINPGKELGRILEEFKRDYGYLWEVNRDEINRQIVDSEPSLIELREIIEDLSNEIRVAEERKNADFDMIPLRISVWDVMEEILKLLKLWREDLCVDLLQKLRRKVARRTKVVNKYGKILRAPVKSIDDMKKIFVYLETVSDDRMETDELHSEATEMLYLLIKHIDTVPETYMDEVYDMGVKNRELMNLEGAMRVKLQELFEPFLEDLQRNMENFCAEWEKFEEEYANAGPLVPGITAKMATDRFFIFSMRFDEIFGLYEANQSGQKLFNVPIVEIEEIHERKKQLDSLRRLYGLYRDTLNLEKKYKATNWFILNVMQMMEDFKEIQNKFTKLPASLHQWEAYGELKRILSGLNEIFPLLELLRNPAIMEHHWDNLSKCLTVQLYPDSPEFTLGSILDTPILEFRDEVEDICIAALKEKEIDEKLRQIDETWSSMKFPVLPFKDRGNFLLKGMETQDLLIQLDDTLLILNSLAANRYNVVFMNRTLHWVDLLSKTSTNLDMWLQVQNLWLYLEAVFVSRDISRQLPLEAKRFANVDMNFSRIVLRAFSIDKLIECCTHHDLQTSFPIIMEELEKCLKSLSSYLERKRKLFPRFYFVSDAILIEILGRASNPKAIQAHLLSLFDGIARVEFSEDGQERIEAFLSNNGERVPLASPVSCTESIETWLGDLLREMQTTIRIIGSDMAKEVVENRAFDFVREFSQYTAQMGIIGLQILWTYGMERAMMKSKRDSGAMKECSTYFLILLNKLIEQTAFELTPLDRTKYEAMITIHLHQRDISRQLYLAKVSSAQSFDWEKQQRFYHLEDTEEIVSRITNVKFFYQNEYLGVTDRLVITPLTDRCYITLAQAIALNMGGAPAGPAGTGKTETTKDMGKSLGKYVVVFNCSDQMDFRGLGQIFKGLMESGSWGCFDEFNRIELAVLSVAAQQISILLTARKNNVPTFTFSDGDTLKLNMECGVFITMNPGYAGRQELPENLKVMFRNVAMMVPDRQIIIRVKLASCGFKENIILARKFFTLYKLCENQLSQQIHYDFGLRNILSVLRTLGVQKRANVGESEQATLMRVLRDMNLSKFIAEDKPIFLSLIRDIFPSVRLIRAQQESLQETIAKYTQEEKLINTPEWNLKVQQLYETCLVRHGIMVMGESFSGKTTAMEVVLEHFRKLGHSYNTIRMNPKAITAAQMFGRLDVATNEWTDGIFSVLFKKIAKAAGNEYFWLILDGPVDTIWIENLNSVLDDTKTLTLANGDRIIMSPNSKLMFEAENVDNASPATVSRLGMVYFGSSVLEWMNILSSWEAKNSKNVVKAAKLCFDRGFRELLELITTELSPKMQITRNAYAKQCTEILDTLLSNHKNPPDDETVQRMTIYSMIWSLGAVLDGNDRRIFEKFTRSNLAELPWPQTEGKQSIFDFFINKTGNWDYWGSNIPAYEVPPDEEFRFTRMIIPNIESLQLTHLMKLLWKAKKPVLLLGEQGTGKTTTVEKFMARLSAEENLSKTLNFSYLTTPKMFQGIIEGSVDKRTGAIYGPPGHKKLTLFIDDLNIPMINEWGDQTTNEIVRQLIEFDGFYSLTKPGTFTKIEDLQFLAAMINPGGGQNDIPNRLKRQFAILTSILPSEESTDRIFREIAQKYFLPGIFSTEIVEFIPTLVTMTRKLWQIAKDNLLPSPAKFHYIFNLRGISGIWQGILQIQPEQCRTIPEIIKLWLHETRRIVSDRCVDEEDRQWFKEAQQKISEEFLEDSSQLPDANEEIFFANFLRDVPVPDEEESLSESVEAVKVYESVRIEECMRKVQDFLDDFNATIRGDKLNLVLFQEALEHLIIISRIINIERGNALLIGIVGYGKRSLTRLASFIAGYEFHQITLTAGYNTGNLLEDIKTAYTAAGLGKGVVFLFREADVVDETFLDHVNNLLMSGEIPNLFTKEDYFDILNELSMQLMRDNPKAEYTNEEKMEMFRTSAKRNFHLVLSFSPIGTNLRGWAIKFPGLLSGCTIDWFQEWPESARLVVARRILDDLDMVCEAEVKERLIRSVSDVHGSIEDVAEEYFERFRRKNYVMPKKFCTFLENYRDFYVKKKEEIEKMSQRMSGGIQKLLDAADSIEILKVELLEKEKHIGQATEEATKALKHVEESTQVAEEVRNRVMKKMTDAEELVREIEKDKAVVEQKLEEARPALEEAAKALLKIKASDLATVRKLTIPPHLVKVIMDCVLIYLNGKMERVSVDKEKNFINTSYKMSMKIMSGTKFLPRLRDFKTDRINDETMDLLVPYFRYPNYNFASAKLACGNVAGLLQWTQAMVKYYGINKDVLPLKDALKIEEVKREVAQKDLEEAQEMLREKEEELAVLQEELNKTTARQEVVMTEARECKNKLDAASQLISGLGDEKVRWSERIEQCASEIQMLIGDVFYMSAFLTYSGVFNEEFRRKITKLLSQKLTEYKLPCQEEQKLEEFFIDPSVVSEWILHGLPQDDFSTENAILVTQATKFPLLIDPQAQGVEWIEAMEKKNDLLVLQQNMKGFQMHVEDAIEAGRVVLLKDVEEKLDPCLTNVLEKNLLKSGTMFKVSIAGKEVTWNDNFRLYVATKMENPHYSPEISTMVNIVDFKVTLTGLENQLLSRVIRYEKAELEQERIGLVEDITSNMQMMEKLERDLLRKLSSIEGSILDDVDLLTMLNHSKTTSIDIREKLRSSAETQKEINKVREEYRPIAKRGSILYALLSTLPKVSHMYRISLAQFLLKVDESLAEASEWGGLVKRIASIIQKLTFNVFTYQSRGLYEEHRYTFILLMAMQIDLQLEAINQAEYDFLLKGGSSVDASSVPKKPFSWIPHDIWLNVVELTKLKRFSALVDSMQEKEKLWRAWYEKSSPENALNPFEKVSGRNFSQFHRLLLIRAFCPDRILSQSYKYIAESLGKEFLQPVMVNFSQLVKESSPLTPLICLLSMGSDPSAEIADLAKKEEIPLQSISMGQGQEELARKLYEGVMRNEGGWLLIQNSHLALEYMAELAPELLEREKSRDFPENTRIWITSAPVEQYPIILLQMSIKYTNEPPSGIKAGLKRTYANLTQDVLDYSNSKFYIPLIYAISFLHTIIQERRKYGPIGWNIPYEFNTADRLSSCLFVQNHLYETQMRKSSIDWTAIRYMLSEVHYGGRVTDDMDKRLLTEFTEMWFNSALAGDDFEFREGFPMVRLKTKELYVKYFNAMDVDEGPEMCGLHQNVEINHNVMIIEGILDTIIAVQPKVATSGKDGETIEVQVTRQVEELLKKLPEPFDALKVEAKLTEMGTLNPMAIFLRQEVNAMQSLLAVVRKNLRDLLLAIDGMIVMSPALQDSMDSLHNGMIPKVWERSSWPTTDKLGFWFANLLQRVEFLNSWIFYGRPNLFWFGGLFNPNGFLTAIRQEGVKQHADWPLDTVKLDNEVLTMMPADCKKAVREGVLMHGLVLEGAGWDRKNSALCELQPKVVHTLMPVFHVFAVSGKVVNTYETYECPVYRTGKRKECVTTFKLRTIKRPRDAKDANWILRGTALITKVLAECIRAAHQQLQPYSRVQEWSQHRCAN